MNSNVNQLIENIQPMVDKLAEKMGVTSQFLWESLVKQVYVFAGGYLIGSLISLLVLIFSVRKAKDLWKKPTVDSADSLFWLICLSVSSGCIFFCLLFNGLARVINPPYYAVKIIIDFIQGY